MARKIIQLVVSAVPAAVGHHDCWDNLYALCDDGAVFMKNYPADVGEQQSEWVRIKDVPQDEEPTP